MGGAGLNEGDLRLRNVTYAMFVELGRAPLAGEVAPRAGLAADQVLGGWRRLHDAHTLVLNPAGVGLMMANPFSAVPTGHRVEAAGRWWYANCAWDAFGILGALHGDGRIETTCPDCGDVIHISVVAAKPDVTDLLFHTLMPAPRWRDEISFT
jgi:alkylmercury lyase-like protein